MYICVTHRKCIRKEIDRVLSGHQLVGMKNISSRDLDYLALVNEEKI